MVHVHTKSKEPIIETQRCHKVKANHPVTSEAKPSPGEPWRQKTKND